MIILLTCFIVTYLVYLCIPDLVYIATLSHLNVQVYEGDTLIQLLFLVPCVCNVLLLGREEAENRYC